MNDKNIEEKARLIAERNKRLDIIKNIHVNKANIEYIAESGSINGSLMLDIEIAMDKYRQATLTQYKEALREVISRYEILERSVMVHPESFLEPANKKISNNKALEMLNSNISARNLAKANKVHISTIYRAKHRADALINELNKE